MFLTMSLSSLRVRLDGPKMAPERPKGPQDGPRGAAGWAQDGPKTAPSRLQVASDGGRSAMQDVVESEPGNAQKKLLDSAP